MEMSILKVRGSSESANFYFNFRSEWMKIYNVNGNHERNVEEKSEIQSEVRNSPVKKVQILQLKLIE